MRIPNTMIRKAFAEKIFRISILPPMQKRRAVHSPVIVAGFLDESNDLVSELEAALVDLVLDAAPCLE